MYWELGECRHIVKGKSIQRMDYVSELFVTTSNAGDSGYVILHISMDSEGKELGNALKPAFYK